MNPRVNYEMTESDLSKIKKACKPVACMVIGGSVGSSQQENANNAWASLGKKMGFDSMTVKPSDGGMRFFTAVPSETEAQRESREQKAQIKKADKRKVDLELTISESLSEIANIDDENPNYDIFMDGDSICATKKDFINLQESPAGFGDTKAEAISELESQL
jgi:hypothetical protein